MRTKIAQMYTKYRVYVDNMGLFVITCNIYDDNGTDMGDERVREILSNP
jgi:hypothetical protein